MKHQQDKQEKAQLPQCSIFPQRTALGEGLLDQLQMWVFSYCWRSTRQKVLAISLTLGSRKRWEWGVWGRLRSAKILRLSWTGEKFLQGQPLKMGLGRGASERPPDRGVSVGINKLTYAWEHSQPGVQSTACEPGLVWNLPGRACVADYGLAWKINLESGLESNSSPVFFVVER